MTSERDWSKFYHTLSHETDEIRLVNVSLNDKDFGMIVEQILHYFRENNQEFTLKKLYLQRNNLSHRSMRYLGFLLQQIRTIEIIELGDNKIGNKGLEMLSSHLSRYFSVRKIFLYQNSITNISPFLNIMRSGKVSKLREGNSLGSMKWRGEMFEDVTHHVISELNFNSNLLGDRGIQQLLESLKKSTCFQTLEILSISECGLTDRGIIPFFTNFLANNPSLLSVDLSRNTISKRCINAILNVASDENIRLINLNLSFDSDESRVKYQTEFNEKVFKRNKTILSIELFHQEFRGKRRRDNEIRQRLVNFSTKRYMNMISKVRKFDFHGRKDMTKIYEGYYGSIKRVRVVDRDIAVKRVLFERLVNNSVSVTKEVLSYRGEQKFLNNAKILKKMNHRNVIEYYGKMINRADGEGYLFFNYHEMTLNRWIEQNYTYGSNQKSEHVEEEEEGEGENPVKNEPEDEKVNKKDICDPNFLRNTIRDIDVLLQICSAMRYIHSLGYVHRDLKPSNILLREVPQPVKMKRERRRKKRIAEYDIMIQQQKKEQQQRRKKIQKTPSKKSKSLDEKGRKVKENFNLPYYEPQLGEYFDYTSKIIDFDFAVNFAKLGETFSIRGTPGFVAPDVVIQGSPLDKRNLVDFSRKIDIYSFGICIFCVLFKQSESRTFEPPGKGVFPDQWSLTRFIAENGMRPMIVQFPFGLEYILCSTFKRRIHREFEKHIRPVLSSGKNIKLVYQRISEFLERERISETIKMIHTMKGNHHLTSSNSSSSSSSSSFPSSNRYGRTKSPLVSSLGGRNYQVGSTSGNGNSSTSSSASTQSSSSSISGTNEQLNIWKIIREEVEKLFPQRRKKSSFLASSGKNSFETSPQLVEEFCRRVWVPVLSGLFFKSVVVEEISRVWEMMTQRMALVTKEDVSNLFLVLERLMFPILFFERKKKFSSSSSSFDSPQSSPSSPVSSSSSPSTPKYSYQKRLHSKKKNKKAFSASPKQENGSTEFLHILEEEYDFLKTEIQKRWNQLVEWNYPIYMRLPCSMLLLMTECWDQDPSKRPSTFNDVYHRLLRIRKEVLIKETDFVDNTSHLRREMKVFEDIEDSSKELEKMDRFYSNEIKRMNRQIKDLQKQIKIYKSKKVENNNKSFQNKKMKKKIAEEIRRIRSACENVFHSMENNL